MNWYPGPTLMDYLDAVDTSLPESGAFVFPVQYVSRPNADFRGFAGSIECGVIRVGDSIQVSHSGLLAQVESIVGLIGHVPHASCGEAITLTLDRQIDVGRGDVLSAGECALEVSDQFEATLVWTGDEPGLPGRSYDIKLGTKWSSATISLIQYGIDLTTLGHAARTTLDTNDIAVCTLTTARPLICAPFEQLPGLGRFILVDRYTHTTAALGMVRRTLRRAQNVYVQPLTIDRPSRERLNGHRAHVLWLTGLSGSGKSTIANALAIALHAKGYRTYVLDGDNLRQGLNKDLGFTDGDRVENVRRVTEVSRVMMDAGLIVMVALISPFRAERDAARDLIGPERFTEGYVSTPLSLCEARAAKGLYKRAHAGLLPNFTGIDSPYEPPEQPGVTIDGTDGNLQAAVALLFDYPKPFLTAW